MKEINLEQILKSFLTVETMSVNSPDYTWNMTLSAMKEACKQTLELAAENADLIETIEEDEKIITREIIINKESIINTINQIKWME